MLAVSLLGAKASGTFLVFVGPIVAIPYDVLIGVTIFSFVLSLQRQNRLGAALGIFVPCLFLAASWSKFTMLGTTALLGDIGLLQDLGRAVPVWSAVLAGCVLLILAAALLANFQLQRQAAVGMAPVLTMAAAMVAVEVSPAAARQAANLMPVRLSDLPFHGHFVHAGLLHVESAVQRHAMREAAAADTTAPHLSPLPSLDRRNVHVIILESFIDPLSFPRFDWPAEPLSPLFTRWRAEGAPEAIVPVFGSRSSNTEFEVLCGVPAAVGASEVVFLRVKAGTRLACLPALLTERGFATIAVTPNSPLFFAADRAYRAMGMAQTAFDADLDMRDLDGMWLSAASTLAQARALFGAARQRDPATPILSYVFVNSAHHPFERNRVLRPDRLLPAPDDPVVRAWANAVHYTALAVEEHVAMLQAADPDALIVVLGDHAPPLGPNLRGYRRGRAIEGGVPLLQRAEMHATPLLVLDRDKLVPLGRLPAWQLPTLLIDILSRGAHCAGGACPHDTPWRLRPLSDVTIAVEAERRGEILCRERTAAQTDLCPALLAEARRLRIGLTQLLLGKDVLARSGAGASLPLP